MIIECSMIPIVSSHLLPHVLPHLPEHFFSLYPKKSDCRISCHAMNFPGEITVPSNFIFFKMCYCYYDYWMFDIFSNEVWDLFFWWVAMLFF
jgi:hypothetical protein